MRLSLEISQLVKFLQDRNFDQLFHANTIETSLSFLSIGRIASRAQLESIKLPQTKQFTDETDKKFGVFDDIFLNFHDHHRLFSRPNSYGPVLFALNSEKLCQYILSISGSVLGVTRKAVEKWTDADQPKDRWVESIESLDTRFEPRNVIPSYKRKFLTDKEAIDIVIHLAQYIPLSVVDRIVIEQHPEIPTIFDDFISKAESVWPPIYKRINIIEKRSGCSGACACVNTAHWQEKNWKLISGFKLGGWEAEKDVRSIPDAG